MANEILCPSCGHSLAFHPYDDSEDGCQAPLGGLTNHAKCGCPMTVHIFIQGLLKQITTQEVEQLKKDKKTLIEGSEALVKLIADVKVSNDNLEDKLKKIGELLKEAKLIETNRLSDWFANDYKRQVHEILDRALLETENINQ